MYKNDSLKCIKVEVFSPHSYSVPNARKKKKREEKTKKFN